MVAIFTSAAGIKPAGKWLTGALAGLCIALAVSQSMAVVKTIRQAPYIKNYWSKRGEAFFGPPEAFSDPGVVKTAMCHYEKLCRSARATIDQYGLMPAARASYTPGADPRAGPPSKREPIGN